MREFRKRPFVGGGGLSKYTDIHYRGQSDNNPDLETAVREALAQIREVFADTFWDFSAVKGCW